MSHEEIAIKVSQVSKSFKLPHERSGTVKSAFTRLLSYVSEKRKFETQKALQDIDFEVKKGEFFGVVGRNGSGKSTLLKMLAGIYQPNKGKITVNGRLVPFIELGVGFNGELTGRENVYLNGALLGFTKKEMDNQYDEIVQFAELEKFMDQKLKNYSSGMQVRLAFSLAIRAETDILLVDEVLAVGDADFQRKCFEYFRSLKKAKKTVIFVSHDMGAVREYCDRAVLIEKSKMILSGKPSEVATAYTRMFMDRSDDEVGTGATSRWGDGKVKYTSVKALPKKLVDQDYVTIEVKAKAHQDITDPVFGFLVKNASDMQLFGTNTKIKRKKIGKVKKGDEITIRWKLPNIFEDGTYFIDAAITHSDTVKPCDWWEDAVSFSALKEERTPYPLQPSVDVEIEGP